MKSQKCSLCRTFRFLCQARVFNPSGFGSKGIGDCATNGKFHPIRVGNTVFSPTVFDEKALPKGIDASFDPRTRKFSEDELKPQPMLRKRKKQYVADDLKNDKYWEKRTRNNNAARKSREAKRLKENQVLLSF